MSNTVNRKKNQICNKFRQVKSIFGVQGNESKLMMIGKIDKKKSLIVLQKHKIF
jgi:hypothetical protein